MAPFRLTNLTRSQEIGANCYLLEAGHRRIVLDCGAHPKFEGFQTLPLLDRLDDLLAGHRLDAIFLSHAHQDHLGSLPVLMRRHPDTPVFATEPTIQLADVMLHNSVNVMLKRKEQGVSEYPLFTHREVTACLKRFQSIPLHLRFSIEGERLRPQDPADVALQLTDAGHILGSAQLTVEAGGRRFLYTGDVNSRNQTLMCGARPPSDPVDIILTESTRGASPEPNGFSRDSEELRFLHAIQEVFAQGGSVLIPVFALGKTQELLAMIHKFRKRGLFPECPIYVGGLSTKLTEVHDRLASASRRQFAGLELANAVAPFTLSGRDLNRIDIRPGRIYALSSGMMTENTLSNLIAPQFLPNPAHAIFFIGYADPESPAGRLRAAKHGTPFMVSPSIEPETLRCRVETFNFSAHSSRESLLEFLQASPASKTVFVHGDPDAQLWMRENARVRIPNSQFPEILPGLPLEL